jgi:hypothetical protein
VQVPQIVGMAGPDGFQAQTTREPGADGVHEPAT